MFELFETFTTSNFDISINSYRIWSKYTQLNVEFTSKCEKLKHIIKKKNELNKNFEEQMETHISRTINQIDQFTYKR